MGQIYVQPTLYRCQKPQSKGVPPPWVAIPYCFPPLIFKQDSAQFTLQVQTWHNNGTPYTPTCDQITTKCCFYVCQWGIRKYLKYQFVPNNFLCSLRGTVIKYLWNCAVCHDTWLEFAGCIWASNINHWLYVSLLLTENALFDNILSIFFVNFGHLFHVYDSHNLHITWSMNSATRLHYWICLLDTL